MVAPFFIPAPPTSAEPSRIKRWLYQVYLFLQEVKNAVGLHNPVLIEEGGTGATTLEQAQENLEIVPLDASTQNNQVLQSIFPDQSFWSANTLSFGGDLSFANSFTTSGSYAVTQTYTGVTNVTFPTTGTLATTTDLGNYLPLTGGTLTGPLSLSSSQPTGLTLNINNTSTSAGAYSRIILQTLQASGDDAYLLFILGGVPNITYAMGVDSTDDNFKISRAFALGTADLSIDTTTGVVSLGSPLPLASGGSNKALTASNGGIVYTDADSMEVLAGTATAGQILRSGSNSAPSWSTTTYPATDAINTIRYFSSANVGANISAAANSVLASNGSSVPAMTTTLPSAVQNNITTTSQGTLTAISAATYTNSGTYTTSMHDGSGNAYTLTQSTIRYSRIGNMLVMTGYLVWSSKGSAIAGNNLRINLPFTSVNDGSTRAGGCVMWSQGIQFGTSNTQLGFDIDPNVNYALLTGFQSNTANTGLRVITVSDTGSAGSLVFNAIMFI